MARTIRDASLKSRAARSRLRPRGKPYYRAVQEGLHLGYRKPKGRLRAGGKWVVRLYTGNQTYEVETIAVADDFSDADGLWVLDYGQAQVRARQMGVERARTAAGIRGPYTVADAMDDYFAYLETEGRSETAIEDARTRDRAFIRPALGSEEVASLTSERLKRWRDALAKAPPRVRTRAGKPQEHRASAPSVGDKSADRAGRARRATANRIWTQLRAALNKAFEHNKVDSDNEWRKIKPFKGVDATRPGHLSVAEAKRLINGCDAEFRPLVQAALLTGARYGQLATLIASDFDPDVGTLRVRTRKGDGSVKEYHVQLTREGAQFFTRRCAGRASSDPIFAKDDGTVWEKSHQARPMLRACTRGKIVPPIGINQLRHTYASLSIKNGVELHYLARNFGHSDTRMVEKHYGHLYESDFVRAIRDGAPRFGLKAGNVARL